MTNPYLDDLIVHIGFEADPAWRAILLLCRSMGAIAVRDLFDEVGGRAAFEARLSRLAALTSTVLPHPKGLFEASRSRLNDEVDAIIARLLGTTG